MSSACASRASTSSDASVERSTGHACRDRVVLRGDLVAGHLEHLGWRADERDAVRGRLLGELGVLGEEAVAGIDRVGARLLRDADDLVDVEVGADRMPLLADLVGLVGLQPVQRVAVLVRVDRDRAGAQFVCGAERPDGDLAAVRDQDLSEHAHLAWAALRSGLSVPSA